MPRLTGTIFTWSPSLTKTTSIGFGGSPAFRSVLLVLVPLLLDASVTVLEAEVFCASSTTLVFPELSPLPSFGRRVVTLWMGTDKTFVRERVSTSALTDIPGRNFSFSLTRILTSNLVASCDCPPPPPGCPAPLDEL